jgi:hypothetical protein
MFSPFNGIRASSFILILRVPYPASSTSAQTDFMRHVNGTAWARGTKKFLQLMRHDLREIYFHFRKTGRIFPLPILIPD